MASNPADCGDFELIATDSVEIIPHHLCGGKLFFQPVITSYATPLLTVFSSLGHAHVVYYDENDLSQEPITGSDMYWTRCVERIILTRYKEYFY